MDRRADAGVAAARTIVGLQAMARGHGGVCTAGRIDLEPGIVTAVPGRAEVLVDQRHLDAGALASMLAEARGLSEDAAAQEGCMVERSALADRAGAVPPGPGRPAREACGAAGGATAALLSGALHDASEMARVCPTAMVFSPSIGGVSHAPGEDTPEADLHAAMAAFGRCAAGHRGSAVKSVRVVVAGGCRGSAFADCRPGSGNGRRGLGAQRPDGRVEARFEGAARRSTPSCPVPPGA